MTTYMSYPSYAPSEYDIHTHILPDGTYAAVHSHAGGHIAHAHQCIQQPDGVWILDELNDPILSHATIPIDWPSPGPNPFVVVNVQPGHHQYPVAQPTGNASQTATEIGEPAKPASKADAIWELLKGAAKQ